MGRQHGAIARWQARELGLSSRAVDWQVESGRWLVAMPGVYRAADAPETPSQQRVVACLWGGPEAVISHETAAGLWDLDVADVSTTHLTRMYGRSARADGLVVHRTRRLDDVDRRVRRGVPVTSVERTLVDLAGRLREEPLEIALESAFKQHLTFLERMRERADALWGRPGLHVLRHLLHVRQNAPAESGLEVQVERFLREFGITGFIRQYEVWDGERWRRLDWANPDVKVALEADSWRYHAGRVDWARGHTRNTRLLALGWLFFPITKESLAAPYETTEQILSTCAQRTPRV